MKTAFLQTGGDSVEAQELWTPGVPELREALGASDGDLLRLLRNVYGSATAPRGLDRRGSDIPTSGWSSTHWRCSVLVLGRGE